MENGRESRGIDLIRRKGYRRFPTTLSVADISRIMHQPARNMFSSFIFFPLFLSLSRRGLFSLRETARPSRYPASVELRARLFEPRVVLGLVSTASETRKGWNDGVAAHSRSRNDINIEEGGENLSKFFLYFSRFLLSFDFWIFSLFFYVTIKTIGRTLCLIIKYAASMNYSFDFYFEIILSLWKFVHLQLFIVCFEY